MNWIILCIAGLFEVAFAFCLGSTMYWWYVVFVIAQAISMMLLMKAIQTLHIGTAYAVDRHRCGNGIGRHTYV